MTAAFIVKWAIVALLVIGALLAITQVGKPRKATTPGIAAISVALCALEIVGIVLLWRT
jgi:hypothetical protein